MWDYTFAKCLWGMVQELGGENLSELAKVSKDAFERARWISQCYVIGAKAYEDDEVSKARLTS